MVGAGRVTSTAASAPARARLDVAHERGGHCTSSALRDLLRFHGLAWGSRPLSEGMVFGLAGGLGFGFAELPDAEPPIYLIGRSAFLDRNALAALGADATLVQTDDADEGWALLRDELDAGRPALIWADVRELDYLDAKLSNTVHAVVACGYDLGTGTATLLDNDRDDAQVVTLECLARARSSQGFPGPNRHALWQVRYPEALPAPEATLRAGVRAAVDAMRRTSPDHVPAGLERVAAFAESYATWPERFGERLGEVLRALRVFVVKAGTGGACYRSLHARFLQDAADLLGDDGLRDAAVAYARLSGRWVALGEAIREDDATAAHAAGRGHVDTIVAGELAGVEAMERWLTSA